MRTDLRCFECGHRPPGAFRRFVVRRVRRRFHRIVDRHAHESKRMRTGVVGWRRGPTLDEATRVLQEHYLAALRHSFERPMWGVKP